MKQVFVQTEQRKLGLGHHLLDKILVGKGGQNAFIVPLQHDQDIHFPSLCALLQGTGNIVRINQFKSQFFILYFMSQLFWKQRICSSPFSQSRVLTWIILTKA